MKNVKKIRQLTMRLKMQWKILIGVLVSGVACGGVLIFANADSSVSLSLTPAQSSVIQGSTSTVIHANLSGTDDEFYDYCYGHLKYRTISFETIVENISNYQGNAVVNYTSHNEPYTRVIEHKHFELFGQEVYDCPKTVVSEEYSTEYKEGMDPYYPVNDDRNNALAEEYRKLAEKEQGVVFGGRLGQYKYFDMAPVIEQVLNLDICI